jgi:hypothetical protein
MQKALACCARLFVCVRAKCHANQMVTLRTSLALLCIKRRKQRSGNILGMPSQAELIGMLLWKTRTHACPRRAAGA